MSKAQASASSFGALQEEFLLSRYIAGLQAENIRTRGIQILFNRMERMSDDMLLKTIRELSTAGHWKREFSRSRFGQRSGYRWKASSLR